MKKNKLELFLDGWKDTLNYLDRHKIQGRILFAGISVSLILIAIKFIANDLIKIIEALQ